MSIVKIRNIELSNDNIFNSYFKDRYCYLVHEYIVPMRPNLDETPEYVDIEKGILYSEYVPLEVLNDVKTWLDNNNKVYINYSDYSYTIDTKNSPVYTSTTYFEKKNNEINSTIPITIDNIKKYRTKVAEFILQGTIYPSSTNPYLELCDKQLSMLTYYRLNMENDVVEGIRLVKDYNVTSETTSTCSCGCSCHSTGLTDISQLLSNNIVCDTLKNYRSSMKLCMMDIFTDLEFWKKISLDYLVAIDNIIDYTQALINSGLSIFNNHNTLDLSYGCSEASETFYQQYLSDLNSILEGFTLIRNKRYDKDSIILSDMELFAKYYEYLQWTDNVVEVEENWC